ncbi:MAG: glycine oxidase ThiO [Gammaproteobacteria bacterium]|nr:MAG: glycine oxidase ThiO [Gammaproteobacteria bacterium]
MHIGIAGGGLLGRLLAWQLLIAGHQVTVVDRDTPENSAGACRVAAAMLAPWSEVLKAETVVFEQGLNGIAQWQQWLAQLQQETGEQVFCSDAGSVLVAHRQDRAELPRLRRDWQHCLGDRAAAVQVLDGAALAALEPELARQFSDALYLPDEACLDNVHLLAVLATALEKRGGRWYVGNIEQAGPQCMQVSGERHVFDHVLDVRGFGAHEAIADLRGVRGEVLWVHAPEVQLRRPVRLVHPRYQLYIAPRPDHRYVIGATEIESEQETPVTVRSSLELLSALYAVHRGFAEATIEHAFARCRPAYPDNLPRIDAYPGYWQVNGLYRHGYLLAPSLVSQVMRLLQNKEEGPWPVRQHLAESVA